MNDKQVMRSWAKEKRAALTDRAEQGAAIAAQLAGSLRLQRASADRSLTLRAILEKVFALTKHLP